MGTGLGNIGPGEVTPILAWRGLSLKDLPMTHCDPYPFPKLGDLKMKLTPYSLPEIFPSPHRQLPNREEMWGSLYFCLSQGPRK